MPAAWIRLPAAAAQEPEQRSDKDHQQPRQFTGKFEQRTLQPGHVKTGIEIVIQRGVDQAVSHAITRDATANNLSSRDMRAIRALRVMSALWLIHILYSNM